MGHPADVRTARTEEKIGHRGNKARWTQKACSGREDGVGKGETQEHSPFGFAQGRQEWLCYTGKRAAQNRPYIWS